MKRNDTSVQNRHARKPKRKVWPIVVAILSTILVLALAAGICVYTFYLSKIDSVGTPAVLETTENSVTLTWHEVEHASDYNIYLKEKDGSFEKVATAHGNQTHSAIVTGLKPATEYDFYVTAHNFFAESKDNETVTAVFTNPEKTELTELEAKNSTALKATWAKSPEAQGYEIQYRPSSEDDYTKTNRITVDSPETLSATLSRLKPETEYTVRVCAFIKNQNLIIRSEWSAEKSASTEKATAAFSKIDVAKPMIALTFDDGPGYGDSGKRILDTLEKYGAKATFFMVGYNATQHPENVKRKAKLGMELGNHTWDHTHYDNDVTADDIKKASDAIFELTGDYPTAFRSPGGMTTDKILAECKKENMTAYNWSVDTADWDGRTADEIYQHVMDNASDGDIILMHEIYDSTAAAVEKMVPALIEKGFQLVTCRDLIFYKTGKEAEAGRQYLDAFE